MRRVHGLIWARPCEQPACIPLPRRVQGAKRAGLKYQRDLGRVLWPWAELGPWFEYVDWSGHRYCQPDFLLSELPRRLIVLEAKYTWTPEAHAQIDYLYRPVLEHYYKCPVTGVVVCKNLRAGMNGCAVFSDLTDACNSRLSRAVLHWIGQPLQVRSLAA